MRWCGADLQESVYNLLDENTGYLSAWVRASSKDEDKDRINAGYEAVVRDQAQVLAKVLREGTPLGREGILNALWDFHIRHYALPQLKSDTVSIGLPAVLTKYVTGVPDLHRPGYEYSPYRETVDFKYDVHNGFFQTRIGNDSDLIHFFKSSGPELEDALLACLKGADDSMKIEVLKAGSTLSEAGDARFALAALEFSEDANAEVRQTVRYVYEGGQRGILNLDTPAGTAARSQAGGQGGGDSRAWKPGQSGGGAAVAGGVAGGFCMGTAADVPKRAARPCWSRPAPEELCAGARCGFFVCQPDAGAEAAATSAGRAEFVDTGDQRAAVRICFEHFMNDPQSEPAVKAAFAKLNTSALQILMEEAAIRNS